MVVPRSYMFANKVRSNSSERRDVESMGVESRKRQSTSPSVHQAAKTTKPEKSSATVARTTEPVSIPSSPMYRPVRHSTASTMLHTGHHRPRRTKRLDTSHDPNALPPAVAALLAVTSIPPPKRKPLRQSSAVPPRQMTIDELIQEWRSEPEQPSSLGNRSPLDILLEPCEDAEVVEETDDLLMSEPDCEKESCSMTSRSVSSASLTSIPSLEAVASTPSSFSNPSTPTPTRRSLMDRKEKIVCSPPEVISHNEDPLRPQSPVETESWDLNRAYFPKPTRQPPKSTLKSNLTASLQALKSAAASFSNFTAPTLPPDDLLTRSLLSPSTAPLYPSEMRPKAIAGVPDAALRRYLNPLAYGTTSASAATSSWSPSAPDAHASMRAALAAPEPGPDAAPMIQMQTYARRRRTTMHRSSSSPSSLPPSSTAFLGPEAAPLAAADGAPRGVRPREHRENSDFLRVVVLEMNMRRGGKLDAKAGGRARVWLPPRKQAPEGAALEGGRVPVRWVGVSAED